MRCNLPHVVTDTLFTSALQGVIGGSLTHVLNSMFQPTPGSARQPYSFDSLCSVNGPYTKYKVLGVAMKITACSQGDTLKTPLHLITRLVNITDNYAIAGAKVETALEKPTTRMNVITAYGSQASVYNINVPDLSVMFNWSKQQYHSDIDNSCGTYATSPSSAVHLDLGIANSFGAPAAPVAVQIYIEFNFDVVFLERQTLPQS